MAENITVPVTTEADFFAAVDEFLRKQEDLEKLAERRKYQRYAYPTEAMVAFCHAGQVPPINWFEAVQCHDISRGGFAFYAHQPPPLSHLVVIFRRHADYLSLFARVAHTRAVRVNGQPLYVIGCQFIGRVVVQPTAELAGQPPQP